jgi:iron complex transport system substrate-binding protein
MAVLEKIATVTEKPSVYYELDNTDPNAPYTVGPGTFIDTLINSAGGKNIIVDLKDQYVQVSVEELLMRNPEIILLGDAAYGVTPESVLQRPGWEKIAAVQNQRVYSFDDNLVSRPGPRLVDGLEQLARLLHPDLFEE